MPTSKMAITLDIELLKKLDRLIEEEAFLSRSRAIQEDCHLLDLLPLLRPLSATAANEYTSASPSHGRKATSRFRPPCADRESAPRSDLQA